MPPLRAKVRPFLDSVFSAGHYVATGVFGYVLLLPQSPIPWLAVVGAMAWAMAMHAYSAVPDIQADKDANLATTATVLGQRYAIWYCLFLYGVASLILIQLTSPIAGFLYVPYLYLLARSFGKDVTGLLRIYRYFPYLNALVGATLFFSAFFSNGWL